MLLFLRQQIIMRTSRHSAVEVGPCMNFFFVFLVLLVWQQIMIAYSVRYLTPLKARYVRAWDGGAASSLCSTNATSVDAVHDGRASKNCLLLVFRHTSEAFPEADRYRLSSLALQPAICLMPYISAFGLAFKTNYRTEHPCR